uniref:Candidate secreted effector n=1 Tax=Meloidogyne incognita TaxID=6306 RepID=A0A914NUM6_MELIC
MQIISISAETCEWFVCRKLSTSSSPSPSSTTSQCERRSFLIILPPKQPFTITGSPHTDVPQRGS